ncbi:hypothetical protein DFJ73DRAFT_939148 [Zopfochytrium polystomum]|nr:hypothetical protein DFJ73DRAFT_939148 [Zopfochytrium polystomum]
MGLASGRQRDRVARDDSNNTRAPNITKNDGTDAVAVAACPARAQLATLPPELLERIFILAASAALPLVNRAFYAIAAPPATKARWLLARYGPRHALAAYWRWGFASRIAGSSGTTGVVVGEALQKRATAAATAVRGVVFPGTQISIAEKGIRGRPPQRKLFTHCCCAAKVAAPTGALVVRACKRGPGGREESNGEDEASRNRGAFQRVWLFNHGSSYATTGRPTDVEVVGNRDVRGNGADGAEEDGVSVVVEDEGDRGDDSDLVEGDDQGENDDSDEEGEDDPFDNPGSRGVSRSGAPAVGAAATAGPYQQQTQPCQLELQQIELVLLLLASGAAVRAGGDMALREAARYGHLRLAETLLRAGANPEVVVPLRSTWLWNALQRAAASRSAAALAAVIAAGPAAVALAGAGPAIPPAHPVAAAAAPPGPMGGAAPPPVPVGGPAAVTVAGAVVAPAHGVGRPAIPQPAARAGAIPAPVHAPQQPQMGRGIALAPQAPLPILFPRPPPMALGRFNPSAGALLAVDPRRGLSPEVRRMLERTPIGGGTVGSSQSLLEGDAAQAPLVLPGPQGPHAVQLPIPTGPLIPPPLAAPAPTPVQASIPTVINQPPQIPQPTPAPHVALSLGTRRSPHRRSVKVSLLLQAVQANHIRLVELLVSPPLPDLLSAPPSHDPNLTQQSDQTRGPTPQNAANSQHPPHQSPQNQSPHLAPRLSPRTLRDALREAFNGGRLEIAQVLIVKGGALPTADMLQDLVARACSQRVSSVLLVRKSRLTDLLPLLLLAITHIPAADFQRVQSLTVRSCAEIGAVAALRAAVERGADTDTWDGHCLYAAVYNGNVEAVRWLVGRPEVRRRRRGVGAGVEARAADDDARGWRRCFGRLGTWREREDGDAAAPRRSVVFGRVLQAASRGLGRLVFAAGWWRWRPGHGDGGGADRAAAAVAAGKKAGAAAAAAARAGAESRPPPVILATADAAADSAATPAGASGPPSRPVADAPPHLPMPPLSPASTTTTATTTAAAPPTRHASALRAAGTTPTAPVATPAPARGHPLPAPAPPAPPPRAPQQQPRCTLSLFTLPKLLFCVTLLSMELLALAAFACLSLLWVCAALQAALPRSGAAAHLLQGVLAGLGAPGAGADGGGGDSGGGNGGGDAATTTLAEMSALVVPCGVALVATYRLVPLHRVAESLWVVLAAQAQWRAAFRERERERRRLEDAGGR